MFSGSERPQDSDEPYIVTVPGQGYQFSAVVKSAPLLAAVRAERWGIVLGSYTALVGEAGTRIRLDVRLQDTSAGETIADVALVGSESNCLTWYLKPVPSYAKSWAWKRSLRWRP